MIDLALLREKKAEVHALILRKEPTFPIDQLEVLDQECRAIRLEVESLRQEKKQLSSKGAGGVSDEIRARSIAIDKVLKEKEQILIEREQERDKLWYACPNIPDPSIQVGNKEANKVVRTIGKKPSIKNPKHHLELNERCKWFDLQAGADLAGAQFVWYTELGTKIIYALSWLMLKNNKKFGFSPVLPPTLVKEHVMFNSGNLPKFAGAFYTIPEDNLCLIPTAEVALGSRHAETIFNSEQLPVRYTAWTSCFRRESGGYGSLERGIIRIHEFEKVELYAICQPEKSDAELEMMVGCAEEILNQLGLHYQVSLLATEDMSFQSAKTYDIEVWLPGQDRFYEVSSASNCKDFQARRAAIRYRAAEGAKPQLVHTLNASSLALPRLMVALMETYQQPDGSVVLPPLLQQTIDMMW